MLMMIATLEKITGANAASQSIQVFGAVWVMKYVVSTPNTVPE
jgi:hypothetical protein